MQLTNLNMHVASLLACGSDPGVLTTEQAHAAMQLHIDCTVDRCEESPPAVVHEPDDTRCDDGNPCTADVCDAQRGCQHADNGRCAPLDVTRACHYMYGAAAGLQYAH